MYFHPTSDRMITSCLKHQPGRGRLRGYAFTMLIGDDQLSVGKLHSGWFLFVFYIAKGTEMAEAQVSWPQDLSDCHRISSTLKSSKVSNGGFQSFLLSF